MQTIDVNGKELSNSFKSAATSYAQFVKPRVVIDFQDARHLTNVVVTTNDAHSSGSLGSYFTKEQVVNSGEYETFPWAVTDAKDNFNNVITANGKYRAMPSDSIDNLKYGWWSASKSDSSGIFGTAPDLDITFDATTINKVKVVTSKNLGQIKSFTISVINSSSTTLLSKTIVFDINNNEFERIINLNDTYTNVARIYITVVSTKNSTDYARILSVSPMYQLDISDYVMYTSENRVRDLHETSLPIAGTSQTSSSITIDNSSKKFNILNTSSDYGKYLQKDVKVNISYGWKSYESTDNIVESYLTTALSSGNTYCYLSNLTEFPYGDTGNTNLESNYFVITVDKNKFEEEKILIKRKKIASSDIWGLEIAQRGYAGTTEIAHSVNAIVTFDPFEYVDIGTFFIEEISSSTTDMGLTLSLQDRFKFLNDKIPQNGFFKDNSTVGEAITDLLYYGNFPNHKIIKFDRFQDSPSVNDAVLHLKFNDDTKNTGNSYVASGLRYRVYQPPLGAESTVKDLQLDINEKQLSDLDKALGVAASVTPSYVGFKSNVNLSSYSLSSDVATLNDSFYQGVFDGYFIPLTTLTDDEIGFEVDEGGARLYLNDTLIADGWNENTSLQYYSNSSPLTFTAGVPYKIRLEFYHTSLSTFTLNLRKSAFQTIIDSDELVTNIVLDHIGSRDAGFTGNDVNRHRNNAIPSNYVNFSNTPSMAWNTDDKSVYLSNTVSGGSTVDSFVRLPYDVSWDVTSNSTNTNRDWSIEYIFKSPQGGLGASGEYISSWSNSSSTAGIEFFYISSTNHGVKLKTLNTSNSATATSTITSSTAMPEPTGWNHVVTSYDYSDNILRYYVDGIEHGNTVLTSGYEPDFGTNDLTLGGRGVYFTSPTNLILNPDFNVDTNNWLPQGGATLSRNTVSPYAGSGDLLVTSSATNYNLAFHDFITVTPNTPYYLSAYCRNVSGSTRLIYIGVQWFTSANTYISEINSASSGSLTTAAGWVRRSASGTSPANAAKARIFLTSGATGLTAGWQTKFDNVLFEQSSSLREFDAHTYGGAAKPTSSINNAGINLYIDEFVIYNKCLSSSDSLKRYQETQIKEIKKFPFLYGINDSVYQIIQNTSFADLGRVFIDEKDNAVYENYYALFENSLSQHANVQKTISDNDFIMDATIQKTLQVNSVVVKISGVASNNLTTQPIWRAPDPTTLGVLTLTANLSNSANSISVSSFDLVPFPKSGYVVIDSEIIKYNNKDNLNFLSIERGALGTTAASHNANSKVREVKYFNFEYDKIPSINVKNPFITGILFEDPDEINILHWSASPFKANLIISASDTNNANTIVFAEGTNPVTSKQAFTSIAGIPIQITDSSNQVVEQKAYNSENRRKYGLKEVVIDSPFITDSVQAQVIADFIIEKLSEPIPIIEVTTTLIPEIQVGDKIRISTLDQFDIINSDYWVISISTSVGTGYTQQMVLRKVV